MSSSLQENVLQTEKREGEPLEEGEDMLTAISAARRTVQNYLLIFYLLLLLTSALLAGVIYYLVPL